MYTPLDALYTYAVERSDLTHWFFNQGLAMGLQLGSLVCLV